MAKKQCYIKVTFKDGSGNYIITVNINLDKAYDELKKFIEHDKIDSYELYDANNKIIT